MTHDPVPEHPRRPEDWAALLKANWSKRAESESRDFYVASHPGWRDPAVWSRQAGVDTRLLLHDLAEEELATTHVLEIGCGVGRLTPHLLEHVASYTGFDIAPGMLAEARQRLRGDGRARFFESDGLSVPEAARDRRYELALAMAVFIHCPKDIVAPLATDAVSLLAPGGRLRFQLLADLDDPTGLEASPETVDSTNREMQAMEDAATGVDLELIEGHYYMGHAFRYDEAQELFGALGGRLQLLRLDLGHIYGDLQVE